jgi:hypothetical protein
MQKTTNSLSTNVQRRGGKSRSWYQNPLGVLVRFRPPAQFSSRFGEAEKIMKASIAGRIQNTHLPKAKALLPLFEAVMNSFQAIEEAGIGNHSLTITAERQGNLDDGKPGPIESFIVTDTGIGFTNDNYDSFNVADSRYKAGRGGKGLGRFLWLKAFERVEVDSHYREVLEGDLLRRNFNFVLSDDEAPCVPVASQLTLPQTTIRLIGYRQPYRDECPRTLDVIAQRLIGHFLPLFLDPKGPALTLRENAKDGEIDLRSFYREHFEALATHHDFTIAGQNFILNGFRFHGATADHHEMVYGANYREVITERISRYLPNLKNRLTDSESGQFVYLAFVQSPYLDRKVNSERTDFSISKEAATEQDGRTDEEAGIDLFTDDISLRAIREAALIAVTEDLKPFLEEINTAKEVALANYVAEDAPQYRVLLKYKSEYIDQVPPLATKAELEMTLHRQLYQHQVRLKQEGASILAEAVDVDDSQEYYTRFKKFVEDENEIGKTALAQYVVHRRVILDLLEKALKQDPESGKYALEKTVHSLVFPMRATSDEVPFEQQNLWMIDERLTFHFFLASDMPLSTLDTVQSDSESRPDLLIFNRPLAFADNEEPLQSIVVIEFKKPDRTNYRDEDPITQVYRMVREIRESKMKSKDGRYIRPANNDIPAYCYIICDLTPPVETRFQNMGARRTPDNLGYYGFNETLNAYYEVISYNKLLLDAKKRNRILFEKLNLPAPQ